MSPPYSYIKSFFWKDEGWTIPWNNFTHLLHLLFHSKLHNNWLVLYQCLSKGVGISSTLPHQIKYPIFIEAKVIPTSKNEECKIKLFPSILLLICFYLSCYLFHTCWWKNTKAHFKNISLSTHCIKGSRLVS